MKKLFIPLALGIVILIWASCKTPAKIEQTPPPPTKNLVVWTAKLQDSLKFTVDQIKSITFYPGSSIQLSGGFFSITSFVENGVIVRVDTTAKHRRSIDSLTQGHILGTPQKDPRSTAIQSMIVRFSKNDMDFDLEWKLDGNGNTVLNKDAKVTFQGKTYAISSYFVDQYGYTKPTNTKLLVELERRSVVIDDTQ